MMFADVVIPEWIASILVGALASASIAVSAWTLRILTSLDRRLAHLETICNEFLGSEAPTFKKTVDCHELRMQHLEDRLGTDPPFCRT